MNRPLRHKLRRLLLFVLLAGAAAVSVHAENDVDQEKPGEGKSLLLDQAVICEDIRDYLPYNRTVVISLEIGKVYCFTSFLSVPEKMYVFHNWYRQDRLVTTKRLLLQPPEWATTSSIQLREADKGPWRVEIKDQNNRLLQTLRFSITD